MISSAKLRIGVLFGGRSGEHAVSLMSARSILEALDASRFEVTQIGITTDGVWLAGNNVLDELEAGQAETLQPVVLLPDPIQRGLHLREESDRGDLLTVFRQLDVIFPVLHGTYGEDGTMQGLFELAGVAYVGAGVLGSAVGMDKGVFKDVLRANKIPVLDSTVLLRSELDRDLNAAISQAEGVAPYPLFTKPANLGSSVGVSKCRNRSDLVEGLLEAAQYDRRIVVERGINAREIEVSVLGNDEPEVSVPGEIIPAGEFYSYEAKYHDERSELIIPARISKEMQDQVRIMARRAYQEIDCAGLARVDFLLDRDDGSLYLNELNTMPGFTSISMYPKLWEVSGLAYQDLVGKLIDLAIERRAERDRTKFIYQRDT